MKNLLLLTGIFVALSGNLYAQEAHNSIISFQPNPYLAQNSSLQPHGSNPDPVYRSDNQRGYRTPLGSNVVSGSPINLTVVNGFACYAFGFTYEHLFGEDQIVGLQIPFYFAFGSRDIFYDDDQGRYYYATPGLQIHVAGARRGFDYAVGPSVLLGNLNEKDNSYYNGVRTTERVLSTFTTGILLDNNLNFQRRSFLFGLNIKLGSTFQNANYDSRFYFQFGLRFGGRF